MEKSLTVLAPAKINLGLKVFPKRADGYHNIESIFSTVGLCDSVTVRLMDKKSCCVVECDGMNLPEDNTFTKTYKAFCVLTGIDRGVHVKVEKKIPAGGGLGGGSSDSSSFLKSIDLLFEARLNDHDLDLISGQVGSDVFFFTKAQFAVEKDSDFLCRRFAALVSGRGEVVKQIEARSDFSVLLVFPGEFVSTPVAYQLVDLKPSTDAANDKLEQVYGSPVKQWTFKNDFTAPVIEKYPKIGYALDMLKEFGADFVDMSGSGSTVFGVFEDKDRARYAMERFDNRFKAVLV